MHELPSRRALLAGTPAAAAAAMAAGTVVNAVAIGKARAGEAGDDAELLSLKPEVDDVLGAWIRQKTRDCIDHREFEKKHLAKFGFDRDQNDGLEVEWSAEQRAAYDRDIRQLIHEHHADRSEDELELRHWDRLNDRLYSIAGRILSYTASTLDGLRLQTRVMIVYRHEIWDALRWSAVEPDDPVMCDFFASLCGMLGVQFPPVPERWQS
jgi:hypothetical protein